MIPHGDYEMLYDEGVAGIFGPGTNIAKAAAQILEVLLDQSSDANPAPPRPA